MTLITMNILKIIKNILYTIAFNIIGTYTCEIYPTKIRDMANGFLFFNARLCGVISQFIGVRLDYLGLFFPYYIIGISAISGGILVYSLPYETMGKSLDSDFGNDKNNIETFESKKESIDLNI